MSEPQSVTIRGIPVSFPCEPYDIQREYMEKVIECLQNETNGVLESPTGTGKTLSLLCASLAWLTVKKAQCQAHFQMASMNHPENEETNRFLDELNEKAGKVGKANTARALMGLPTIIYSSRTHSQLSQAMQELKRTAYSYMKATVIGSREQMCIHPEVMREPEMSAKVHMCRLKVKMRSCQFYNRVERKKDDPEIQNQSIIDIEDLVKLGQNHKCCPYYLAKEIKNNADIVFMPYNYLLDPRVRKSLGVELNNNIVILDEAHNIERMCEDSASLQIKNTDITLCIEEVTEVMKAMSEESDFMSNDAPKDITADELCILKEMLLNFEKAVDGIEVNNLQEGTTYEGNYIFTVFEKAGVSFLEMNSKIEV